MYSKCKKGEVQTSSFHSMNQLVEELF